MTWVQTPSGKIVDLLDPQQSQREGQIDPHDIAHNLSRLRRFQGQSPVTVAVHSVLVAELVWRDTGRTEAKLAALLHDAHEAYIGDLAGPVMAALEPTARAGLAALTTRLDAAIAAHFGLAPDAFTRHHATIKAADIQALRWERDTFLGGPSRPWGDAIEAAEPVPPSLAERTMRRLIDGIWEKLVPCVSGSPTEVDRATAHRLRRGQPKKIASAQDVENARKEAEMAFVARAVRFEVSRA